MQKRERHSKIEVTVIDVEKVMADLTKSFKESGACPENVEKVFPRSSEWGYVETPIGLFLLDDEACSPAGNDEPIVDDRKVMWPLYFNFKDSFTIVPSLAIHLTDYEIRELPTKGKKNFAEFVRRFGDRLETNFSNWNDYLEEVCLLRSA